MPGMTRANKDLINTVPLNTPLPELKQKKQKLDPRCPATLFN